MHIGLSTNRSSKEMVLAIALIGGIISIVFYLTCLLFGKCYREYDSTIVNLEICSNTSQRPVETISVNTKLLVCGQIEGTTPRPGGLYLFYEDRVIFTTDFRQDPGDFQQLISLDKPLIVGEYRVEIGYAKQILAETKFEVIAQ